MSKKKPKVNEKLQAWIDARKRHRLSHAHVHMARELGMNPKKLGKIDNHHQEPWKAPLRDFIEHLYEKRFGKAQPDVVVTIEDVIRREAEKKVRRREVKLQRKLGAEPEPRTNESPSGLNLANSEDRVGTGAETIQDSDEMSVLQ